MRRLFLTALPIALCSTAGQAEDAKLRACDGVFRPMEPLFYAPVEQHADSTLTFRLCAAAATAPKVISSDIEAIPSGYDGRPAGLPMAKDALGYWTATTPAPVPAGTYSYGFQVEGMPVADPQAQDFTMNYRGVQSVVEVKGPAGVFQSYDPAIAHGAVSVIEYASASLGEKRRARVYTPPGYEKGGNTRYPVMYLVHGAGDSDDSWVSRGHAHYILDNLIAANKAAPMIIVMPAGHTVWKPGLNLFMNQSFGDDLIKDLVPHIDVTYRTIKAPAKRAMVGLSMGGAHTLSYGLPNADVFGPIGIFSMGFFQPDQSAPYRAAFDQKLKARAKAPYPVFYAMGKTDFLHSAVKPTQDIMNSYGIRFIYRESEGGHTWTNWREYLREFAQSAFK